LERCTIGRREGLEVEVRCPTCERSRTVGRDADELKALREHLIIAGFDLVCQQEEDMRLITLVGRVHKNGTLAEEIAMLFEKYVANGKHQRMAGMKHGGEGRAGP